MKKRAHAFLSWLITVVMILCVLPANITRALEPDPDNENITLTLNYNGQTHEYKALPIRLIINGNEVSGLDMPPVLLYDYTLVPARAVLELMGAEVIWQDAAQEITVSLEKDTVKLKINDTAARVNDTLIDMPVAAMLINEKTMIPLRFVADNLNFLVNWDDSSRTVYIDDVRGDIATAPEPEPPVTPVSNNEQAQTDDTDTEVSINRNDAASKNILPAVDKSETEIEPQEHRETTITSITAPEGGNNFFTVNAASAISKVEKKLLNDNRMYIEIYGALLDAPQSSYSFTNNPDVALVNAAQNRVEPEKVVRIVFYLKSGAGYFVSLSPDRKTLTVGFRRNVIQDFALTTANGRDVLTITGEMAPSVSILPSSNETVLTIKIPYTDIKTGEKKSVAGEFAQAVTSVQDGDAAVITLDLNAKASYSLSYEGASAVITLYMPTHKNISYDYENKRIVLNKTPGVDINISTFIHKDNYSEFRYVITLPADLSAYFGSGEHIVNDSYINFISVTTQAGQTSITIDETRVLAYNIYEDTSSIYIQPVLPREKYDRIVVIDPGHGGSDPGTKGHGIIEKDLNLDIALRLASMLEGGGNIKVYSTRLTDVYPSLEERVIFATENGDLFVSIHNNFAGTVPEVPNSRISGTEVYFYAHEYDKTSGMPAERAAELMQKKLVAALGSTDRGVLTNNYYVLTTAKIPAVLCEIGYLSHPEEAAKLATSEYKTLAALGLYAGIIDVFANYKPKR